ncbi:MAG: proprotein convertase P-domain-containing protein [Pseudomonadota bacterium]
MVRSIQTFARRLSVVALWALLFVVAWIADPQVAHAQAVASASRTDDGAVGSGQVCGTSPLVRTFNITDSFVIGDVDLGVIVTHTWRGDVRITLQSPAGTTVQLTNGDIDNTSGNNFNVLLNDEGTQLVNTDGTTRNQAGNTQPNFQNNYIPNNPLSAFDGQNSAGIWRMEICDLFTGADNGTFRYAELTVTEAVQSADLSLQKSVSNANPVFGTDVSFTLSLSNAGPDAATNVEVLDQLPAGFTFISSSGFGTYNDATGVWSVPSVASGQTRSITLTGTVSAPVGSTITNIAQVNASDQDDPDSIPANSVASEDDYAEVSLTVAPNPPGTSTPISCPVGQTVFEWSQINWPRGTTSNSYQLGAFGTIGFNITNEGQWIPKADYGGVIPGTSATITGGDSNAGSSLVYHVNRANRAQQSVTTITLPRAFTGVQFRIFDIDSSGGFQDRATVYGFLNGVRVNAQLSQSASNLSSGDTVLGNGSSSDTQGFGNTTVTFTNPVDTIIFEYGNGPGAPADPTNQGVALNNLTFCNPQVANLSVTKVSSLISDPVNGTTNPKAIPGAVVEYVISVSNSGAGATDANSVVITDEQSGELKLCRLNQSGGPIVFSDPGNTTGLTYDPATDLAFSEVGNAGFGYSANDDGTGCDAGIDGFRLTPGGAMQGGSSFTLRVRYELIDDGAPTN